MTAPRPLTLNAQRMRVLCAAVPGALPPLTLDAWPATVGLEDHAQLARVLARTRWSLDLKRHCLAEHQHGPWQTARRIWLRGTATLARPSGGTIKRRWISIALAMVNARCTGPDSGYARALDAAEARLAELRQATDPAQILALLQAPLDLDSV